ncbi:hypothetical protein ACP275_12G158600 [Erythranthe tilingii]
MRAGGGCALQQALTPDAAAVIKQAVLLAKRRGHAQVTPLHVANTMLAATNGLFRVACLDSHSHPLQCKALELCFNVALNRLPATSSSTNSHHPMLSPASTTPHQLYSHQYPSISNALVAAFKRAQAHQRRGSIENHHHPPPPPQQQSILAVKIELEQLIISILDDPSVSRVMREAGFSSTQVKTNVERAVSSLESYSKTPPPPPPPPITTTSPENNNHQPAASRNEDINTVIETLLARRKSRKGSIVIVGESTSTLENTVKGVMDRVDRGSVPESLTEVKFITIPPLYSFCNLRREEVEQKIGELTCLVDSLVGKGVVLYIGDLKWISDYRVSLSDQDQRNNSYYCSVEHVIMELGRLVWRRIINNNNNNGENEKFWLMGIANFQTYMSCRNGGHSSLETLWGLHPLTLPANTLTFSLLSQSDELIKEGDRRTENQSSSSSSQFTNGEVKVVFTCCDDCSAKLEAEIRNVENDACKISVNPTLPSWLKDESARLSNNDQKYEEAVLREDIHKKWNKFCSSAHKQETLITTYLTRPTSSSNPNSASSSDVMMEMEYCYTQRFKEFNAENLNIICNALEKKVPWQKEIIPEIAGTILQCRSGMLRRRREDQIKVNADVCNKEETWLCFLGPDGGGGGGTRGKEEISRELARVVFGSYSSFVSVGLSSFASSEKCRNKRGRDEESCMSYMDRFARAVSENPHRVFLVEDLDQADYCSKMRIKRAIETGRLTGQSGDDVGFGDAIIILSCEPSSRAAAAKQSTASRGVSLDLNLWSFDGDSTVDDDVGILENVDRRVVFKFQDL